MYKVIVIDEDGKEHIFNNVLDYNLIDAEMVQDITKSDFETGLTTEELEDLQKRLFYWEKLPDTTQLEGLIQDIIEERDND